MMFYVRPVDVTFYGATGLLLAPISLVSFSSKKTNI